MRRLHYNKAAGCFNEALPLGNGFMGAMCYGGNAVDMFRLNADSLWSGGFRDRINPDAKENIPKIRELIRLGRIREAEKLANLSMAAIPDEQRHYEPLCDLFLIPESAGDVPVFGLREAWSGSIYKTLPCENYVRELDIDSGIHRVSYTLDGVFHSREAFISYPDRVMLIRCQGSPLSVIIERGTHMPSLTRLDESTLCMEGIAGSDGIRYCFCIRAAFGSLGIIGRTLRCERDCVLLASCETSFYSDDPKGAVISRLDAAEALGYDALKARHTADFTRLTGRCYIELDCEDRNDIPTDKRVEAVKNGGEDTGLLELSFAYGRYMLISSSRKGSLPANLQGIWNDSFSPAWGSKFTININTQMNYWPAESCGLPECHLPLFGHIKRMYPHGKQAAEKMYGARGWVAHHNTDVWGDCAPQDTLPSSSYWQMGAAWLCLHILEHYRFTGDEKFLDEYIFYAKEAVLFFEDTLIENERGELVVSPTISPENSYLDSGGEPVSLCAGAAMDSQILRELLSGLIETGRLSSGEKARYEALLRKLPPIQLNENGTIREWADDLTETDPGHRHISHLFALYPGTGIDFADKELTEAARKTLERRLSHGGAGTGWSRAWITAMYAALRDSESAFDGLKRYLAGSVLPNLLDDHPPFQIDGNFGTTAAIAEMLLQSRNGRIALLPALPKAWSSGRARGLVARGNIRVDIDWADGRLTKAVMTAQNEQTASIEGIGKITLKKGENIII